MTYPIKFSSMVAIAASSASVLSSFGETLAQPATSNQSKWSGEQIQIVQKNCVEAAASLKDSNISISPKAANNLCECFSDSISSRYEYLDLVNNAQKYTEQLTKDGTIQKCGKALIETK